MVEKSNDPDPARGLHGRRQGRPLRLGQRALINEVLPSRLLTLPDDGQIDPQNLFAEPPEVYWLEIGFGGGEHLAWQAARNRDQDRKVGHIGAEVFINGIAKLLRQLQQDDTLSRVRVHQGDARTLIEALPDNILSRVDLLFPDPWPKRRHHKRRFIQPEALAALSRVMKADGELRIATDDPGYLTWILRHMGQAPYFHWTAKRASDWRNQPDDWPATRYEEKARAAGRPPTFLRYLHHPHP